MTKPMIHTNPLYQLLREERITEFNERRARGESAVLSGGDYRGLDLRNINADGIDFRDAYFRNSDLRGVDFRNAQLEGASIAEAHISGCYFPAELSADEIRMSLNLGTRMRYRQASK